jgi:hypothetical protein
VPQAWLFLDATISPALLADVVFSLDKLLGSADVILTIAAFSRKCPKVTMHYNTPRLVSDYVLNAFII